MNFVVEDEIDVVAGAGLDTNYTAVLPATGVQITRSSSNACTKHKHKSSILRRSKSSKSKGRSAAISPAAGFGTDVSTEGVVTRISKVKVETARPNSLKLNSLVSLAAV